MEGGKKRGPAHSMSAMCEGGDTHKAGNSQDGTQKEAPKQVYNSCCNLLIGRGKSCRMDSESEGKGPLQPPPSCITASPIFGLHDSNNFFLASSTSPPQFHSRAITPFSPKELLTVHFPPRGKNAYFPFRKRDGGKGGREAGCLNLRGIAFCIHYTAKCGPNNSHRLREIA